MLTKEEIKLAVAHMTKEQLIELVAELTISEQEKREELDKISQRLSNKGFVDRAPKNIVEQEKNNYSNLEDNIKKISLTIESL